MLGNEDTSALFDEARRRLDNQEKRMDDLRGRMLNILAGAGVTMGLFGLQLFSGSSISGTQLGLAIVASASFVVCAVSTAVAQLSYWLDLGDRLAPWVDKAYDSTSSAHPQEFKLAMAQSFVDAANGTNAKALNDMISIGRFVVGSFILEVLLWVTVVLLR